MKQEDGSVAMEEESKAAPAAEEEDVDDLDLLLAGGGDSKAAVNGDGGMTAKQESVRDGIKRETTDVSAPARANYVCVVSRLHHVELYSLPSFVLLFRCRRFSAARQTLIDSADELPSHYIHAVSDENLPSLTDVAMHRFSEHDSSLPVTARSHRTQRPAHLSGLLISTSRLVQSSHTSFQSIQSQHYHSTTFINPSRPPLTTEYASSNAAGGWLYGERFVAFRLCRSLVFAVGGLSSAAAVQPSRPAAAARPTAGPRRRQRGE